ncbi:MAG: hypothetical protein ACRD8U_14850, partial [Pyrinomonadaceae bacterium]
MPTTVGEKIAAQGWSAGTVVPHNFVPVLAQYLAHPNRAPAQVRNEDWLVVVSQPCDVIANTLEQEPFVEVLHCRPVQGLRRQYKDLRSTRFLDFKPNRETHEAVVLSAHATADRYLIPRELLQDLNPDPTRRLSDTSRARVLAWYSLRSGRPAWPNAFVARIDPAKRTLEETLEPLADDIAEVRISIAERDDELPEGADYHVAVFF